MIVRLLRFLAGLAVLSGLVLAGVGALLWTAATLPGWLALALILLLAGASVGAVLGERT